METVRLVQRRGSRTATYEILAEGVHVIEESPHRGDDVVIPWRLLTGRRIRTTRYPRTWLGAAGLSAVMALALIVGAATGEDSSLGALAFWLVLAAASAFVVARAWRHEIVVPALPRPLVLDASRPSRRDVTRFLDACEAQRQAWEAARAQAPGADSDDGLFGDETLAAEREIAVARALGARTHGDDEVH